MKQNYRDNPELKWQYLGTEDGLLLNFPSYRLSSCGDYDPRFRYIIQIFHFIICPNFLFIKVNTNEACYTRSDSSPSSIRYPTDRIMDVMKQNYRDNPELKWQYLGTEDGLLLNFPSYRLSSCGDYDPRFRYIIQIFHCFEGNIPECLSREICRKYNI